MPQILHTYDHYLLAAIALFGTLGSGMVLLWLGHSRHAATIRAFRGLSPPFVNVVGVLFAASAAPTAAIVLVQGNPYLQPVSPAPLAALVVR